MIDVTDIFKIRLRNLRGKKNQDTVAKEIGISRASLSYYETGDRKPDINTLYALAQYYNVSSDYLLGLTDVASPNIDEQAISKKTGLSEDSIYHLELLQNTIDPKYEELSIVRLLTLKTINLILEEEADDLLCNLAYYFFVSFTHYGNWFDETEDTHPISELSLSNKLLHISYSEDYDFFSNAFLLMIEKDLREIREKYIYKIEHEFLPYKDVELSYSEICNLLEKFFNKYQSNKHTI